MVRKRKWKKFFNKFHVYGGLLTVGFLISFSYSAFVHQHHPKFIKAGEKETHWSQTLEMPPIEDNHEFKLAVRDSLELFGHAPWWEDGHILSGLLCMIFLVWRCWSLPSAAF